MKKKAHLKQFSHSLWSFNNKMILWIPNYNKTEPKVDDETIVDCRLMLEVLNKKGKVDNDDGHDGKDKIVINCHALK